MRRKLDMYAQYLPKPKKEDIALLVEDVLAEDKHTVDPISMLEYKIGDLLKEIERKKRDIKELQRIQREEFVPVEVKEEMTESLNRLQRDLEALMEQNTSVRDESSQKDEVIAKLQQSLKEKSMAYDYLMQQYHDLATSLQKSKPQ